MSEQYCEWQASRDRNSRLVEGFGEGGECVILCWPCHWCSFTWSTKENSAILSAEPYAWWNYIVHHEARISFWSSRSCCHACRFQPCFTINVHQWCKKSYVKVGNLCLDLVGLRRLIHLDHGQRWLLTTSTYLDHGQRWLLTTSTYV